jgi:hypothetical protein
LGFWGMRGCLGVSGAARFIRPMQYVGTGFGGFKRVWRVLGVAKRCLGGLRVGRGSSGPCGLLVGGGGVASLVD